MTLINRFLIATAFTVLFSQAASAQVDYIAQVAQIRQQIAQRQNYYEQQVIQSHRQQYNDYQTPDSQILAHYVQQSRIQNPGFYQNLAAREQAFYQQQAAYTANRNAIMDSMHNSYMQRSEQQYAGHQKYIRNAIYEQSNLMDNQGNVTQLPNYNPGVVYSDSYGNQFMQNQAGQWFKADSSGYLYSMGSAE